eukprot:CAMPEP_0115047010 /NCGR_PEP_ID=MMETSP0216-20121206/49069_1 /TAXON_ID=223996 /ORGANISM="Protocruzia adherens, Strain Boccale" /LENGTH=603 /DNA_ID=CAMNT_0002430159 /DNA_START=1863 /DNA_END=3670 /DNA_ORIENTATION=-
MRSLPAWTQKLPSITHAFLKNSNKSPYFHLEKPDTTPEFPALSSLWLSNLTFGDPKTGPRGEALNIFRCFHFNSLVKLVIEDTILRDFQFESLVTGIEASNCLKELEVRNVMLSPLREDEERMRIWHQAIEKFLISFVQKEATLTDFVFIPSYPTAGFPSEEHLQTVSRIFPLIEAFLENSKRHLQSFWIRILPSWKKVLEYNDLFLPLLDKQEFPTLKYLFGCELDVLNSEKHLDQLVESHYFHEKPAITAPNKLPGCDIYFILVNMYEKDRILFDEWVFDVYDFFSKVGERLMFSVRDTEDYTSILSGYILSARSNIVSTIRHTGVIYPEYFEAFNKFLQAHNVLESLELINTNIRENTQQVNETIIEELHKMEFSTFVLNSRHKGGLNPAWTWLTTMTDHPTLENLIIDFPLSQGAIYVGLLQTFFEAKTDFRKITIKVVPWTNDCFPLIKAIKKSYPQELTLLVENFDIDDYQHLEFLETGPFKTIEPSCEVTLPSNLTELALFNHFHPATGRERILNFEPRLHFSLFPSDDQIINGALSMLSNIELINLHSSWFWELESEEIQDFLTKLMKNSKNVHLIHLLEAGSFNSSEVIDMVRT